MPAAALLAAAAWVTVSGPGCTFSLPKAVAPVTEQQGDVRATVWKLKVPGEQYAVRCTEDPKESVDQLAKMATVFGEPPGFVRKTLPGGAVELSFPGSLTRISQKPNSQRICLVGAASETTTLSPNARKFVDSFAWTK